MRLVIGTLLLLVSAITMSHLPLPTWLLIFLGMMLTNATWALAIWKGTR